MSIGGWCRAKSWQMTCFMNKKTVKYQQNGALGFYFLGSGHLNDKKQTMVFLFGVGCDTSRIMQ